MINYPRLTALRTRQETVDTFRGYDRNVRIKEGAFRDMRNLTGDHYPVMAVRGKRTIVADMSGAEGEITGVFPADRLGVLHTQGEKLYCNGAVLADMGLSDRPKRFVTMGQHLIILPDMKYINMESPQDFGPIGHSVEDPQGEVTFELCNVQGQVYAEATISDAAPASPADKALWIDTSLGDKVLKQYSKTLDTWVTIENTYVKISGLHCEGFNQYDGVTISGITEERAKHLNGRAVLQGESDATIIIPGFVEKTVKQDCATAGTIRVERKVPIVDYVVEAGNRLWGCRYGFDANGEFVNKIYGSKLGDFRNWECFMGLASDSWECDVGSQGPFTGAANVAGSPVFYKEETRHKIWISDVGAHQAAATPCQGVMYGCGGSVANMDGAAIYKSRRGFCLDDGSGPEEIGACFAAREYGNAVACVSAHKYYVSMKDDDGWHLFVYDADKKLWHREDDFHASALWGGSTWIAAVRAESKKILDLTSRILNEGDGIVEGAVSWMAETGEIGLEDPGRKYISRLTLRLNMEVGAELTVFVQYDTEPEWVALGSIRGTCLQSFSLPLRLRRCDHFRLRLEGVGDVKLYSITKTIQEGSVFP